MASPSKIRIRAYMIWRCSACRHIVPRDYGQRTNPGPCRGRDQCPGHYFKDAFFEPYFESPSNHYDGRSETEIKMTLSSNHQKNHSKHHRKALP